MASYQSFKIFASRLEDFEDVKAILWSIGKYIHLHCDSAGIQENFCRENEWGYHPAIRIRKKNLYSVEIWHIGFYPLSLLDKLLLIKKRLRKRFPYTQIYYLNIEKLGKL